MRCRDRACVRTRRWRMDKCPRDEAATGAGRVFWCRGRLCLQARRKPAIVGCDGAGGAPASPKQAADALSRGDLQLPETVDRGHQWTGGRRRHHLGDIADGCPDRGPRRQDRLHLCPPRPCSGSRQRLVSPKGRLLQVPGQVPSPAGPSMRMLAMAGSSPKSSSSAELLHRVAAREIAHDDGSRTSASPVKLTR